MSEEEKANWQKIKDVMEEKGTTDNMFYKRACAIVAGQPDPVEPPPHTQHCSAALKSSVSYAPAHPLDPSLS